MPTWYGDFQFSSFVGLFLNESMNIFALGFPRVLVTLFPCCLSIWLFLYVLYVPIFCSKIVLLPLHPVVGIFSWILPLFAENFCCFEMTRLFCIVCTCLDIFFVSLLSSVPSDLSPRVLSFILIVVFLFFFIPIYSKVVGHYNQFLCCCNFLKFVFPVEIPIKVLISCFCCFGEYQF